MKFLLAHGYDEGYADFPRLKAWIERLRAAGFAIDDFYVGMKVRGMRLSFKDLDYRWKTRDGALLEMYESLARVSEDYDVLINFGGVNLHPDFLRMLTTINVLRFSDDPESSEQVSRPIASDHDICAVANIAAVENYRRWGVRHAYWVPNGFWHDDYEPSLTEAGIASGVRDVDVALLCERVNAYRRATVDRYSLAFPSGVFRGPGWPEGFLPESERVPLLQRAKIGVNIHNSTGPINYRTFYLPANGVMQICDNKQHLGQIFKLDTEVVGYDSIDEAIELTRYFLEHHDERRAIAVAGYRRAIADYNEIECFNRLLATVLQFVAAGDKRAPINEPALMLTSHLHRQVAAGSAPKASIMYWPTRIVSRVVGGGARRTAFVLASANLRVRRAVKKIFSSRTHPS